MRKGFLIGLAVYAMIAVNVQSQASASKPLDTVQYRPVGNLIYLPVQVNGSRIFSFCFDTGAPTSIIDTAVAHIVGLKALSSGVIHGAGRGDVSAADAGPVTLKVGGLITTVPNARIVDLSKVPGVIKDDGLVGAEFLEQYVVRIDPILHTIAFYDPKTFRYDGGGTSIPLELTEHRLYVHVGLAAIPGKIVDRKVRVDTGSEDSVDDDTVRSSPTLQKTILGNGLGTSYEDVSGVYDTVLFGPYRFRHVWGPAGAVAIVGMEMLRRFTLTFDAQRGLLYLEPNSNFNAPVPSPK